MREEPGYGVSEAGQGLEQVWGEGFMSPGGREEVARILGEIDLTGMAVLDIGCGLGGPATALVVDHHADRVVGADVQLGLLELARTRAEQAGLESRLTFEVVEEGRPLPFLDGAFDVVFSKDAIIHVEDKLGLYTELHRVLRPGGHLLVSDWLRGAGQDLDAQVEEFIDAAGHAFTMVTLDDLAQIARGAGFVDIETMDRHAWYLEEARAEREHLPEEEREFWDVLVTTLEFGALRPGHLRARRPGK